MRKISVCARCHRVIPAGEEMIERIGGIYVTTHLECHRAACDVGKKDLDTMIHEALRHGPSADIKKKR